MGHEKIQLKIDNLIKSEIISHAVSFRHHENPTG